VETRSRPRNGWLRAIRVLLVLALVGDLLALPLLLLPGGDVPFARVGIGALIDPQAPPFHIRFPQLSIGETVVSYGAQRPSYLQHLLYSLEQSLAYILATIPMLFYAIRTVEDALRGDPFTPAMVRRLRNLGLMVLVGGLLSEVVGYLAGTMLIRISLPDDHLLRFDAQPLWQLDLWWVLPAFTLLAVSAVVKRGVDLRAELDGLI
jgi:hypothetical protein